MAKISSLLPILPKYLGIVRSQYASPAAIDAQSRQRLEETLRAAAEVPFYRERLGRIPQPSNFQSYPILIRAEIPALNLSVRERIRSGVDFHHDNSSGSTGM